MTRFRAGSASDIGRARSVNQDLALVDDRIFAVADGMGGHDGGELAARLAVEGVRENLDADSVDGVVAAVQAANDAVVARTREDPDLRGMGTTFTGLAGVTSDAGDRIVVVNVGDSRAYLLQDTGLCQITHDHSLVALLVEQGTITPKEAERHPQRNIVTRALGIEERVLVDSFELVPVTGDRYLICSDGLFNEVSADVIAQTLRTRTHPGEAAEALVELANESGGRDNITCVVVDVVDGSGDPVSSPLDRVIDVTTGQHRAVVDAEALANELAHPSAVAPHDAVAEASVSPPTASPVGGDAAAHDAGAAGETEIPAASHGDLLATDAPVETDAAPIGAASRQLDDLEPVPPRRMTWRVAIFGGAVGVALLVAVFAVWFSANNTYYVGVDDEEVAIFEGRPGGVLWMDPSVKERTGIIAADLPAALVAELEGGKDEDSLRSAREYVEFLEEQVGRAPDAGPDPPAGDEDSSGEGPP